MRPTRTEMYMRIASEVSTRSTCLRAQVGAIIVKSTAIISTGYNGAPAGLEHCNNENCGTGENGGCENTIHAEANAIIFAARAGISVQDTTLYCTHAPCLNCSKLIINSGITSVIFKKSYRDSRGIQLMLLAGISVYQYHFADGKIEFKEITLNA